MSDNEQYVQEMQEFLRNLGQPVQKNAKVTYLDPPKPGEHRQVVVLDRVKQDVTPEYCVHGYAECTRCRQPVWLGHESEKIVSSGQALPVCLECARSDFEPEAWGNPVGHVKDHLRKNGPHT